MGYRPEACDQCGICNIQNAVEADGSVYPCDFYVLDEYKLGNFNTDQLDSIDRKRAEIGFIERSKKLKKNCLSCPYFPSVVADARETVIWIWQVDFM